ncbi:glycosyltransferase family A protein [Embleya scabrispora]|nr:glycosyltransferase family A protein [Embleya scabrispora]
MRIPATELRRLLAPIVSGTGRVPGATPARGPARLTVGICTYDDFDGAWFTIASLLLHHGEVMPVTEILLIDNNPEGAAAGVLKSLEAGVPNLRYVPVTTVRSTAVKHMVFPLAAGEIVVVLDSHVLLVAGALRAVLDYFDRRPGCRDLVQGPLLHDDAVTVCGTHLTPVWSDGMHGQWAVDDRAKDPAAGEFDIPMQGTGVFACRRDAWPGLSTRFRGFGCEEGYLHEKIRRNGGRTVCLPALRWLHRFERPSGVPYRLAWEDHLRNYLIAWSELGWDTGPVLRHFGEHMAPESVRSVHDAVGVELAHPAALFDGALYPVELGRGRPAPTAESPEPGTSARPPVPCGVAVAAVAHGDPQVAELLTHRRLLIHAHLHGWDSVLVADSLRTLSACTHERLRCEHAPHPDLAVHVPEVNRRGNGGTTGMIVAYRRAAYRSVLAELPAGPRTARRWLDRNGPVPAWLASKAAEAAGGL